MASGDALLVMWPISTMSASTSGRSASGALSILQMDRRNAHS